MSNKKFNTLVITGSLTAIGASLCCITPVLALIAGSSGLASTFSWVEPLRPYLIGLTIVILVFAWYQKLKPRSKEEIECDCEDEKPSIWQTKTFLGIITIFAIFMLALPYYSCAFYPENELSESVNIDNSATYKINITGMTCTGCEAHVKSEVAKLPGILNLEVSYIQGDALITIDESKTSLEQVEIVINKTGYKAASINKSK